MPVDIITLPTAILGLALLWTRLTLFRGKPFARATRTLNWVLFVPISVAWLIPLLVLHILSMFGSTEAMLALSRRYQTGLDGFGFNRMALHYCDEAIENGSVEAMLRKSGLLVFRLEAEWPLFESYVGDPDSSFYKSSEWIEALDLANRAAATGEPECINAANSLAMLPNPRAFGDGVYLVERAKKKARRVHVNRTSAYYAYLHQSDDWKEGMKMLKTESKNNWVRDVYFLELIEERTALDNLSCNKLWTSLGEYSGGAPLGMRREERVKLVSDTKWQSGMKMLEESAGAGDEAAADILSRAKEFVNR